MDQIVGSRGTHGWSDDARLLAAFRRSKRASQFLSEELAPNSSWRIQNVVIGSRECFEDLQEPAPVGRERINIGTWIYGIS